MLLLVTAPALANAPVDQYEPFLIETPTIKDHFTGLEWDRAVSARGALADAKTWCGGRAAVLGGTAFRVPTSKELMTLVDEQIHYEYEGISQPAKAIDRYAFPGTPSEAFWSATLLPNQSGKVQAVDFQTGATAVLDMTVAGYRTRCVR
jgi:hypothetical protein